MLILAGQGNPGSKYAGNRHNAGFLILDNIHEAHRFGPWRSKFESLVSDGTIDGQKCLLVKPQTFYNESGRAVGAAARFYKVPADQIIVFHDEIDLAPGRLRVKQGGGHSGNNGIRSILQHLEPDVRRVRIGVGHPGDKSRVMPYVLSDFSKSDHDWFEPMSQAIAHSLGFLVTGDDERFQTEVMRLAPAPKRDPRQS